MLLPHLHSSLSNIFLFFPSPPLTFLIFCGTYTMSPFLLLSICKQYKCSSRSRSQKRVSNMLLIKFIVLLLVQQWVFTTVCSQHHPSPHYSIDRDKAALLAFKKTISLDPKSTLSNWNESVNVCNFTGVLCNKWHHRVVSLNLTETHLVGLLSPFLSNLTRLNVLELVGNYLHGFIPPEFSTIRCLSILRITDNNLQGPIPESFSFLSNLELAHLNNNSLTGSIPPSFFSNCTLLRNIDFSGNSLTGEIPKEIGNCRNLWNLNLYDNRLRGQLPLSLINASSMWLIDVEDNSLSGELPSEIIGRLHSLKYLHLSSNPMKSHNNNTDLDPFFKSLAGCPNLSELELGGMDLGGMLPGSIGQLTLRLYSLQLQDNQIVGPLPPSLYKLSGLETISLSGNHLDGSISPEISRLKNLERLFLSRNFLNGSIPTKLSQISGLGLLDLSDNKLSGEIPESLGDLGQLTALFLNNNLLSGRIPPKLMNLSKVYKLDLSYNQLTGVIPKEIANLKEIRILLNLSHNNLEGNLPLELSKLQKLQEMDLSRNKFNGSIFSLISDCLELKTINLSHNSLTGSLPSSLEDLRNLEILDVSKNQLSGSIPESLKNISTLTFLNLSSNKFEGMVPSGGIFDHITYTSISDNKDLCGAIKLGLPACPHKKHLFQSHIFLVIFVVVIFVSACLTFLCCMIGYRRIRLMIAARKSNIANAPKEPELVLNFPRISHKELIEATGKFDESRLLGSGSYGRVYKGVLADGTAIAVKVLTVQSGNSTKSFNRECQVLKRIRHRNLIRIITACSLPDFKAIVLPYMANGSLESRLYPHSETGLGSGPSDLSLIQRVNICCDVAEGMAYLHHHSPVRVIHCDLKPSNVLLNDDMTALVSDFGIARLVMTAGGGTAALNENVGSSTANMLCGSIGYIAPEYGFGSNTSIKGDVYSFGVLVLEMVTRKRPTDDMFVGGLNLHKWVKSHFHGRMNNGSMETIIDSSLLRASKDQSPEVQRMWEVALGELIELGILCTQESPSTRPTMLDAADDLDRLKRHLNGDTTATATFASSLGISSSTLSLGDD